MRDTSFRGGRDQIVAGKVEEHGEGAFAQELPGNHLPPVRYRDLPDSLPLRTVLGPGIVSIGIGLASGEFILWPYISSLVGLAFLWAAIVAVVTQFFINMEVERYTLATGETAITGFSRFWKPWSLIFCIAAIIPNLFPAWITSGATVFTFAIGGGNVVLISIIGLLVIGLALTLSPIIYQTVEKVEFFKAGVVILFLVVTIFAAITAETTRDLSQVVTNFGQIPEGLAPALVLSGIAAAGAGGMHNLAQSNWIRDKGFGMGRFIPRIVSPITGEDQATPSTGYMVSDSEENRRRWRGWWRVANVEQLVTFVLFGLITITLMSMLASSTVFGQDRFAEPDFTFLQGEGEALRSSVGRWFEILFYAIGAVSLFASALGILDYVGRIVGDALKVSYLADSTFWTESKIYSLVVWTEIIVGCGILLVGLDAPLILLLIAQSINGIVMVVYSALLIKLNRSTMPAFAKPSGGRTAVMVWAVLFYGFFAGWLLLTQTQQLLGGG